MPIKAEAVQVIADFAVDQPTRHERVAEFIGECQVLGDEGIPQTDIPKRTKNSPEMFILRW
jgi:hypothetical protein